MRTITLTPADESARADWLAGNRLAYSVPALRGLVSLLGENWNTIGAAIQAACPERPAPARRTLQAWASGETAPTALEWLGLQAVAPLPCTCTVRVTLDGVLVWPTDIATDLGVDR